MSSPQPAIRTRSYRPGDHPPVVSLWRRAGIEISPSDGSEEMARALRRDPELFVVATHGGRIVGAVLGRFDGRRGWINHLAVDPRYQRRGLGARLVREVVRRLRRAGCPKVNLHVLPANRAVVGFYQRLGFRPVPMLYLERWLRKGGRGRTHRPRAPEGSRSRSLTPRRRRPSAS